MVKKILFASLFLFVISSGYASAIVTCSITAVGGVTFGNYASGQSNPEYGAGSVTVNCTFTTPDTSAPYSIEMDSSVTPGTYKLLNGGSFINYGLYKDTGYSLIWGTLLSGNAMTGLSGTGINQTYTVYGKIPALQTFSVFGAYTDNVTVTITF
ncbi:MAG: spore coat protein U domain-containing protein [Deltaproteobacteria bacterium]|nr:spore coat protein U domain-containing protein [Deltaproteobacteria bacterium]